MKCHQFIRNIESYIHNHLLLGERMKMETHMAHCEECKSRLEAMMRIEKVVEMEKYWAIQNQPHTTERMMEFINQVEIRRPIGKKAQMVVAVVAVAASLFAGFLIGNIADMDSTTDIITDEMAFYNDAEMEQINYLLTEAH